MEITGAGVGFLPHLLRMAKKVLAAFLLMVIAAWAEMTMAPMFAMHAAHMRPGHEMAADMPAEHAGHRHAEHAQMAGGRTCCPGLRPSAPTPALELFSGSPACDDPHSCCFRQGPQSVPAPASNLQPLVRKMAPAETVTIAPTLADATISSRAHAATLSPPPEIFGMTLRV